ncbi:hypothetical protein BFS06_14520 [Clostridium perfringens]|uniref:Uncharacterized protein n=2 Tax=Clostridium perfringens TaxID=1502 RepID=A0A140GRA3_CLOPF|nr:hypothetical protein [Clostridium perfringens]AMN31062.1 hypothetical protein JFP838_pA0146 [Clostridium perfringens]TBX14419.1 hypothetical protein BFS06_14520 [Clostridium perfringens]
MNMGKDLFSIEDLKEEYEKSKDNCEIIEVMPGVYEFKNEELRRNLKRKADELLLPEQRLAIYMHKNMCKYNHTSECSWDYEINDLMHDWTRSTHLEYLNKAKGLLELLDFETAKKVIDKLYN